jgi:hypothetical protein
MLDTTRAFRLQAVRPSNRRRHPHYQIRRGQRRAAVQALTAAKLWLGVPIPAPTQTEAAVMAGSNLAYLKAAAIVIEHGDESLIAQVKAGRVPLLQAAKRVRGRVDLIRAYREAGPLDRAALGRAVGAVAIFDAAVVPAL